MFLNLHWDNIQQKRKLDLYILFKEKQRFKLPKGKCFFKDNNID